MFRVLVTLASGELGISSTMQSFGPTSVLIVGSVGLCVIMVFRIGFGDK